MSNAKHEKMTNLRLVKQETRPLEHEDNGSDSGTRTLEPDTNYHGHSRSAQDNHHTLGQSPLPGHERGARWVE